MIKKFFQWLFGDRITNLETRVATFEKIQEVNNELFVVVFKALQDETVRRLEDFKAIEQLAQLALMNHKRLQLLEEFKSSREKTPETTELN